ncbi:MAG: VOC family protein [Halieaceae bacterium]|jgi:uncharacterized glyoxalase superfamily metalloenzyme YdcJ|nr:VOC family protein [Halieaceae bacterium]
MSPDQLRNRFAIALQDMYRAEVPAYARLHDLVIENNEAWLREHGDARADDRAAVAAISAQRHGAIRVGRGEELAWLARLFALLGMEPVDFYDLVPAGLPVMSTAFRPTRPEAFEHNHFRMFCSLLRPELIANADVRTRVEALLGAREIFSPRLKTLIGDAERAGGVDVERVDEFLGEALDVFRWRGQARVDQPTYAALAGEHKLIADVAAFGGPHINHLTPSALDIDRLQAAMIERGFNAKAVVEGPPRREVPILLRQTACTAEAEAVRFEAVDGSVEQGSHTARFGEVEQRGAALTAAGRALYDRCLETARQMAKDRPYAEALEEAFADFPDDLPALVEADLVYCRFALSAEDQTVKFDTAQDRAQALRAGRLRAEPIRYEDFLPVSAAGIFRSNLGDAEDESYAAASSREDFERVLGRSLRQSQNIYAEQQAVSLRAIAPAMADAG